MVKKVWLQSQTKYLAFVQAISSGVLYGASQLHGVLNDSSVKDALGQITLPKWFPFMLLGLAALTYVAHGHKDD